MSAAVYAGHGRAPPGGWDGARRARAGRSGRLLGRPAGGGAPAVPAGGRGGGRQVPRRSGAGPGGQLRRCRRPGPGVWSVGGGGEGPGPLGRRPRRGGLLGRGLGDLVREPQPRPEPPRPTRRPRCPRAPRPRGRRPRVLCRRRLLCRRPPAGASAPSASARWPRRWPRWPPAGAPGWPRWWRAARAPTRRAAPRRWRCRRRSGRRGPRRRRRRSRGSAGRRSGSRRRCPGSCSRPRRGRSSCRGSRSTGMPSFLASLTARCSFLVSTIQTALGTLAMSRRPPRVFSSLSFSRRRTRSSFFVIPEPATSSKSTVSSSRMRWTRLLTVWKLVSMPPSQRWLT